MNEKWREDAKIALGQYRYNNNNYYMSDEAMVEFTLEYSVQILEGLLSSCGNVSGYFCDLWYMEGHMACMGLMEAIKDITGISVFDNPSQPELSA